MDNNAKWNSAPETSINVGARVENRRNKGIELEVFAKMLEEARSMFERGDLRGAMQINNEFRQVGYSVIVREGMLQIQNDTTPQQGEF